ARGALLELTGQFWGPLLRHDDKRQRILAAATAVFAERDFHRVLVSEVASRAGVGKGTVYLYFPTKDHLHRVALEASLERLAGARRAAPGSAATGAATWRPPSCSGSRALPSSSTRPRTGRRRSRRASSTSTCTASARPRRCAGSGGRREAARCPGAPGGARGGLRRALGSRTGGRS